MSMTPAEKFNALLGSARAARLYAGRGFRVEWTDRGQLLTTELASIYVHPWQTSAWYRPATRERKGAWVANVRQGFIGAKNAYAELPVARAPKATLERLTTIQKTSKSTNALDLTKPDTVIPSPLYDRPEIELHFRLLGFDDPNRNPYPSYFTSLGVQAAPSTPALDAGGDFQPQNIEETTRQPGSRLLRACDLVLTYPRANLNYEQVETGVASNPLRTVVTISTPDADAKATVSAVDLFTPINAEKQLNSFAAAQADPAYDQILISTVYLLSPVDAETYSAPDSSWSAFYKHNLFWNLNWDQPRIPLQTQKDGSLSLDVSTLAGGFAQNIANDLLSPVNANYEASIAALKNQSLAGTFYTI